MADLAITGLVFPLPDPQNAVAPTGRRWSKGWRSADSPWPCPVWLSRPAGSCASTESHGGSDRLGACDRAWDRLQSSIPGRCGVARRPKERRDGDLRGLRQRLRQGLSGDRGRRDPYLRQRLRRLPGPRAPQLTGTPTVTLCHSGPRSTPAAALPISSLSSRGAIGLSRAASLPQGSNGPTATARRWRRPERFYDPPGTAGVAAGVAAGPICGWSAPSASPGPRRGPAGPSTTSRSSTRSSWRSPCMTVAAAGSALSPICSNTRWWAELRGIRMIPVARRRGAARIPRPPVRPWMPGRRCRSIPRARSCRPGRPARPGASLVALRARGGCCRLGFARW